MDKFLQKDGGQIFELFGVTHLYTLTVFFVLGVLIYLSRNVFEKQRYNQSLRFFMAAILILSEICLTWWLVWTEEWTIAYSLPLHLSSLSLFTSVFMLLTKSFLLFEFTYFAGLGSAVQAMLTPDIYSYTFPHFRYVHFYISHGFVVLACLFMIFVEHYQPTLKSLFRAFLLLNGYAAIIYIVNLFINGNFMYLMRKPANPSVLDFLGPWPFYILALEGLVLLSFALLYLPFFINQWLNKKRVTH